eukprot:TRINITY_DN27699_c0_g1_i1.p1 TRINITY_DN27699_c0_g1~~TRINITY_DN27699_c0_g1_i1.p1  ORF type:complete len:212 (-),score=43.20 TRINITY_DN27699_c0_g1_i1:189-824(-)
MQRGLVGSEMCIRDRYQRRVHGETLIISYRCYKTQNLIFAESIDGENWIDYELEKQREENSEGFSVAYNKETNRMFVSEASRYKYLGQFGVNILTEYKLGGIFIKLESDPLEYVNKQSLITFRVSESLNIVNLYYANSYGSDQEGKCYKINPDKPWSISAFPLPIFGENNYQIEFHVYNSYLYAIGKGNAKIIASRRMKLKSEEQKLRPEQ